MSFPFKITPVEPELNKKLMSNFKGERTGFVYVGPQKWIMPAAYEQVAHKYYNFPLRSDDVWIVTYPRTGTTVTQELIWMVNNNHNYELSEKEDLLHRFPFIEFSCIQHENVIAEFREQNKNSPDDLAYLDFFHKPGYEILADMPSPRHIKTHLPLSLLPPDLTKKCKVVYNARNAKDVCESYFHHNMLINLHGYQGDFKTYWDYFKNDLLMWSPYWEHVKEGWQARNNPNVFFLFYEDIVKDMHGTIRKIAKFLEKPITDEQVNKLADHLQINNFREKVKFIRPVPGIMNDYKKFVRKGQTGSNELFDESLLKEANEWIEENCKKIGIQFPS